MCVDTDIWTYKVKTVEVGWMIDKQESQMAYGAADEALSTVLVMFKKMFLF